MLFITCCWRSVKEERHNVTSAPAADFGVFHANLIMPNNCSQSNSGSAVFMVRQGGGGVPLP